jgi:exopolysaccharide biosynthesis polyprenyl glycosylphosphotransferase
MYLALSLILGDLIVIPPFLLGIVYQIGVVFIMSYCCNRIYFTLYAARKMLAVFADDEQGKTLIRKMIKIPERFKIERGVSLNRHSVEEIKELIDSYEAVILSEFEKSVKDELLRYCYSNGKRVYLLPSSTDIIVNNSATIQIFDTPVLMCRARGLSNEQAMIKRAMDIFVSAVGILITWPIMLGFAVAIKLCDGGPVLFKQNRITKDGKVFNVLKFRSMIPDADKNEVKGTTDNDDRITPVGKIMRPIRVDELPQLFNILFGDMSLVGPRPERIENVYEYTKAYPDFDLRHRVKGGLTGYAQIYGKYNTSPEDKLNMDLIYIEQYSLLMDIKLILMTIKILFMKESTEGFTEKNNVVLKKSKKEVESNEF